MVPEEGTRMFRATSAAMPTRTVEGTSDKLGERRPTPRGSHNTLAPARVHDPLENEAERAVAFVMRMPGPAQSAPTLPHRGTGASVPCQTGRGALPDAVSAALQSPGDALDTTSRAFFEPRLGHDFGAVRVHHDRRAADSAGAVAALAYTVGSHIVFGADQYQSATSRGRRLIAHELAHVVQQSGGSRSITGLSGTYPRIQRFESFEHIQLGDSGTGVGSGLTLIECHGRDLPQHAAPVTTWPAPWQTYYATLNTEQKRAITVGLTYGEIVALSGDMYDSFAALNRAPLREVIDLIPLVRNRTTTTTQLQVATGGRYLALAKDNISHFSNVPTGQRNRDVWRANHIEAIAAARSGDANLAWGLNAAGDHYLTDAFSAGHVRTDRATLHAGGNRGNTQSKILHDLDNQFGVEMQNDRGDPHWTAYGDEHLNDPLDAANRAKVLEAVELSKKDIADALSQGMAYPIPTAATVFAAEPLIPRPVDPATDNWTGRQTNPFKPGNPFTTSTDYERERRSLIASEGPGIVSETVDDDVHVRDWVANMDTAALGRQSEADKIRMITTLLGGIVSNADMTAIESLLGSVKTAGELARLRSRFQSDAKGLANADFSSRMQTALNRKI